MREVGLRGELWRNNLMVNGKKILTGQTPCPHCGFGIKKNREILAKCPKCDKAIVPVFRGKSKNSMIRRYVADAETSVVEKGVTVIGYPIEDQI